MQKVFPPARFAGNALQMALMIAAAAGLLLPGIALAETIAKSSTASISDVCEPLPEINEKQFEPFIEAMLVPGKPMDVAEMMKNMPPETMAKIADMQKTMAEKQKKDWANICRYDTENAEVLAGGVRPDVIFTGDSITENWKHADPGFFSDKVLDRGISGQTTPQILLRFYPDVIALKPKIVHIMAGTNDVAGNTGPTADQTILDNIRAMIDMAIANRIAVVVAAIPPAKEFGWTEKIEAAERIAALNSEIEKIAKERGITFVNYGDVLADSQGGLSTSMGNDGVHPNRDGYEAMRPLAEKAIAETMK